jgi:geranylgeranyl diphosphate synthase, type I
VTTLETGRTRTAADVLDDCRAQVEPAVRAAVDTLPPVTRHICGYHAGWWDEDGRPTGGGGKAVRPAMALLAAAAVGGAQTAAVPAAVAVELVHDFSLLHDDVMDRDRTRRHRPTAWTVFGVGPAILAGDALLALATDVLAEHPAAVRTLATAVQQLVDGQMADLAFEHRGDVGLEECLTMATGKTGALLGAACALGAQLGGAPPDAVHGMAAFGRDIGLAFQLVDDLLGIWGEPARTGKPVWSDLRSRKKSLPVVAALTSGTAAGNELAGLYLRERPLDERELGHAAALVDDASGRAWSGRRAEALTASALHHLARHAVAAEPAAELQALALLLTRRDR